MSNTKRIQKSSLYPASDTNHVRFVPQLGLRFHQIHQKFIDSMVPCSAKKGLEAQSDTSTQMSIWSMISGCPVLQDKDLIGEYQNGWRADRWVPQHQSLCSCMGMHMWKSGNVAITHVKYHF